MVQGLGFAFERICILKMANCSRSFLDYKVPLALDIPPIETILWTVMTPMVLSDKGLGEPVLVPVPCAISNAIYDAVGIRLTELPFSPERVREAWKKKQRKAGEA